MDARYLKVLKTGDEDELLSRKFWLDVDMIE